VATLRRILFAALSIALMLLAAMFAYSNPTPIDIDLGFVKLERVSAALAFAVVFVAGWLFGLLTVALTLWRSATEKRRLRKSLRHAEAELSTLRSAPLQDAH
jgi:putative membrane protein